MNGKRVLWLQTQSWHWASSFFGCTPVAQCIIFKKLSHVGMDYDPFRFFFCKGKSVICYVIPPFSRRATLRSSVHLLTRSPRVRCQYHHFWGVSAALKYLFRVLLRFGSSLAYSSSFTKSQSGALVRWQELPRRFTQLPFKLSHSTEVEFVRFFVGVSLAYSDFFIA